MSLQCIRTSIGKQLISMKFSFLSVARINPKRQVANNTLLRGRFSQPPRGPVPLQDFFTYVYQE